MELRTACDTDIPALYALWHEAFGDEQPVIDAFFQTCYKPENTLIAAENGMPVSVLYWIEADYRSVGETFSACYIFAAATAKSARSKGYMSALLDYARRTAEKRQIDLLFLVPAEETLFAYYGARGYINAFSKTVYNLTDAQLLRCAGALAKRREPTAEQWASARETALHAVPHIVWNEPALRLALRYGAMFDTEILVADDGYFTAERDGETVAVSEFCAVNGALPALCGALLETVPAKRYTLCTPCGIQVPTVFGKGETVQNGMLLPLSDRAKRTARIKDAYIGITLG